MNSDKPGRLETPARSNGNAMIYILLALALLAALTMAITRQNDTAGGDNLDQEKAQLLTTQMVAYAGTVKNAVDQMMMSGTSINNLSLVRPNETSYDTAPHYNKVFHPEGGGVTLAPSNPEIFTLADPTPKPGWYLGRFNNIEWTPTASKDLMLVAFGISESLCAALNKKITGSPAIPILGDYAEEVFVDTLQGGGSSNTDFTKSLCVPCDGYPSMCVRDSTPEYAYYNIISGQ